MSVLFKALSRAAKTRESVTGSAPIGQPSILSRGGSRGGSKRVLMLAGALCVGLAGGTYLFFIAGDDSPPAARTAPAKPRPRPVIPGAAQQQAAVAPPAADAAPPASAPAPAAAAAPAPVLDSPPVAQTAAAAPAIVPPMPVEPVKPAPAVTAALPAGVVMPAAGPAPAVKAKPVMPVEEDLPTLLARLRRQKLEPALSQPVTVARSAAARDLIDDEGRTAIRVGVGPQASQDAAHAAYDDLLQGRYEEALGNYDKALAAEPRNATLLLGKATALQKLGRIADARKAYNMVLAVDPKNREALTNATTLLAAQAPERALGDLRALRQANPGFSPIEAEIGAQEAAAGNVPAAIEAMGHAVSLSPGNGLYRLNLAILQDRAGMGADAAVSYRAALGLLSSDGAANLPLPVEQIRRRLTYLEGR